MLCPYGIVDRSGILFGRMFLTTKAFFICGNFWRRNLLQQNQGVALLRGGYAKGRLLYDAFITGYFLRDVDENIYA